MTSELEAMLGACVGPGWRIFAHLGAMLRWLHLGSNLAALALSLPDQKHVKV